MNGSNDVSMEGFRTYYRRELLPWLESEKASQAATQERARGRMKVFYFVAPVLALGVIGAGLWALFTNTENVGALANILLALLVLVPLVFVFVPLGLFAWARNARVGWDTAFRADFLTRAFSYFQLDYSAEPSGTVDIPYRLVRLLGQFGDCRVKDVISGQLDGVPIEMLDAVDIEDVSPGNPRVTFNGLLACLTLPRSLNGFTFIRNYGPAPNSPPKGVEGSVKPVALESDAFTHLFNTYATDQVEARTLLTPAVMERIVELAQLLGGKRLRVAFVYDRLWIAIHEGHDYFVSMTASSDLMDEDNVDTVFQPILKIFEIIDTFRLSRNTLK